MSETLTTPGVGAGLTRRHRTIALVVVLLAFFMDVLDGTIVNVAIPSIQQSLGASYSAIQWIIAGYALAFALFLITGGRLGDIWGYKKLFLAGIVGFTAASAFCGFATTTEMLVAGRLVQGFMAAMMVPQILSIIQVMYTTLEERRGVSAFYGGLAGIATVTGPILGALLISGDLWGLGWRAIFLVNLPVGVVATILAVIYLPDAKSPHPLHLDLVGVALILVAMLLLMYPLIEGRQLDWPVWVFVSMLASIPAFVLFAFSQVWKDRRDGSPLVVPALFKKRSFVAGIITSGSLFAIVYGFFLVLTLFLQVGLGYPVLKAGLTGIPFSLGVAVAAGSSGPLLVPRFGRNIISAGPVVMATGMTLFLITIRHFGADLTPWELIPSLVLTGVGMGFVVAPIYQFILAEVPIKDAGSASGVINAMGQIGGAIGIAVIGTVFFGLIGTGAQESVQSVRPDLVADMTDIGVPKSQLPKLTSSFETCFTDRANAKDLSSEPASCKRGEAALAENEESDPQSIAAIRASLTARGKEANQRNFIDAVENTLIWEIAALGLVFCVTFLLPPRPRSKEELARIAAETGIRI
jgi:EmrB/QacA subfamily drug resistance transporter